VGLIFQRTTKVITKINLTIGKREKYTRILVTSFGPGKWADIYVVTYPYPSQMSTIMKKLLLVNFPSNTTFFLTLMPRKSLFYFLTYHLKHSFSYEIRTEFIYQKNYLNVGWWWHNLIRLKIDIRNIFQSLLLNSSSKKSSFCNMGILSCQITFSVFVLSWE
jgi:hypothetical protein